MFGKTGSGKSSLCNSLFGQEICPISDVAACTRDTKDVLLKMGQKGIKLIDVPGVGECEKRDEEYAQLYLKLLPELDLVLWLLKGDDRAYSSDEAFYKDIVKPHLDQGKPLLFVVNQADKIEPFREWDEKNHEPGPKQLQNIDRKVNEVRSYFDVPTSKIIPVSANERYNLIKLVDEMVFALPPEKRITVFKEVEKELRSEKATKRVKKDFVDTVLDGISGAIEKVMDTASKVWDIVTGGGCFITTSTCFALKRGDNCSELNAFRTFRDNWLAKEPDGQR